MTEVFTYDDTGEQPEGTGRISVDEYKNPSGERSESPLNAPGESLATPLTLTTDGAPGCYACERDGVRAWIITDANGHEIINAGHDTVIDFDALPLIVTAVNEYDSTKAKVEKLTKAVRYILMCVDGGCTSIQDGSPAVNMLRAALIESPAETK